MTAVFPHLDEAAAAVDLFLDNMRPLTASFDDVVPAKKNVDADMMVEPLDLTPTLNRLIEQEYKFNELRSQQGYYTNDPIVDEPITTIEIMPPPSSDFVGGCSVHKSRQPTKQSKQVSVDSLHNTVSSMLRRGSVNSDHSDAASSESGASVVEMSATINSLCTCDPFSEMTAWTMHVSEDTNRKPSLANSMRSAVSPMENPDSPFSYAARQVSVVDENAPIITLDNRQPAMLPPAATKANATPWKGKGKLPPIRTIDWEQIPEDDVRDFCNAYTESQPQIDMSICVAPDPEVVRDTPLDNDRRRSTAGALAMKRQLDMIRQARKNEKPKPDPKSVRKAAEKAARKALEEAKAQKVKQQRQMLAMSERMTANEGRMRTELAYLDKEGQQRRVREEEYRRRREEEKMAAALALQKQLEAEEAERARLARIKSCAVCGDDKDQDEFPIKSPTSRCQHAPQLCLDCLDMWVASALDDNGVDAIKCPECPEKLSYDDVHDATSPITFEAYDKAATNNALSSLPDFNWCLAPGCKSGQLNVENSNFMACASCNYKQCLKHAVPWHTGETCEQYEYRTSGAKAREEEEQTMAMLDSISKKCPGPNCGWRIQKTDGCDHITCRKCRHEFCWQCLASHKEIKRVGNTAHARDCKFHSENLDLAWPFNRH